MFVTSLSDIARSESFAGHYAWIIFQRKNDCKVEIHQYIHSVLALYPNRPGRGLTWFHVFTKFCFI